MKSQLVLGAAAGQFGGRAFGHLDTVVDDEHLVGQLLGFIHQVGGDQHRDPVGPQTIDQLPHHDPGVGVHAGSRFVEEHHFGTTHQRAGQGKSLLLPTRQSPVGGALGVDQSEVLQKPVRVDGVRRVRRAQAQHLSGPGARIRSATLEHHTDPASHLVVVGEWVQAEETHLTLVRGLKTLADLDGGGLTRSIRTENCQDLAALQFEVEAAHGSGITEAFDESLD